MHLMLFFEGEKLGEVEWKVDANALLVSGKKEASFGLH